MRWILAVGAVAMAGFAGGCGGSDGVEGPPVATGETLGDSLALALRDELERRAVFGTDIGERGGMCRGGPVRWDCTVDVVIDGRIRDKRTYSLRAREDGCWIARQTGTDVGATGEPNRPTHPGVLRGCLE